MLKPQSLSHWWVLPIFLLGLFLRTTGLDWDHFEHFHPDERYIAWVGTTIEFQGHQSWGEWLDPERSAWNPYRWPARETTENVVVPFDQPRNFAYGHFPLYLGVWLTHRAAAAPPLPDRLAGIEPFIWLFNVDDANEFDHIAAVGRFVNGVFDAILICILYWLGLQLFRDPRIALLGSLLFALNVMHIQHARFWVTDGLMTFFIVVAVTCWATAAARPSGRPIWWGLGGLAWGLAIGSKVTAVFLIFPILIATVLAGKRHFWKPLIGTGCIAVVVFILTNPFAVLDWSCQAQAPLIGIDLQSCFLENIGRESGMVSGDIAFPFVRQYDETTPYIYPLMMQLRWGMGWPLGLTAFAGVLVASGAWVTSNWGGAIKRWRVDAIQDPAWLVILGWCLIYFGLTGYLHTKYMRYFLPLSPFLMCFAAWLLFQIKWRPARWGMIGLIVAPTLLYAIAFVNMYNTPHPWVVASDTVHCTYSRRARIAYELWDEPLPNKTVLFQNCAAGQFQIVELNWLSRSFSRDTEAKMAENLERLASSDVYIVASNRSYGTLERLPNSYPTSSGFHEALFQEELGFELAFVAGRSPSLWGWSLVSDRFEVAGLDLPAEVEAYYGSRRQIRGRFADENYTVYDQPLVLVFENRDRLSAEEMAARLEK